MPPSSSGMRPLKDQHQALSSHAPAKPRRGTPFAFPALVNLTHKLSLPILTVFTSQEHPSQHRLLDWAIVADDFVRIRDPTLTAGSTFVYPSSSCKGCNHNGIEGSPRRHTLGPFSRGIAHVEWRMYGPRAKGGRGAYLPRLTEHGQRASKQWKTMYARRGSW
jgi:hypothetical protein